MALLENVLCPFNNSVVVAGEMNLNFQYHFSQSLTHTQCTCTCVIRVSCGIYMYVCVSEYVHDWQIHEAHLDALLIVTTSFHLCELKRIKRTFPVIPCKCTVLL